MAKAKQTTVKEFTVEKKASKKVEFVLDLMTSAQEVYKIGDVVTVGKLVNKFVNPDHVNYGDKPIDYRNFISMKDVEDACNVYYALHKSEKNTAFPCVINDMNSKNTDVLKRTIVFKSLEKLEIEKIDNGLKSLTLEQVTKRTVKMLADNNIDIKDFLTAMKKATTETTETTETKAFNILTRLFA